MPLRPVRREGSKLWHTDGTVAGRRIRQSLGTGDKALADQLCAALERRLWTGHIYGESAVRTFEEAALAYLEAGGEGCYLPPLLKLFKGRVLGSIQPGEIRAAAQKLYPGRKRKGGVFVPAKPATWNRNCITPARAVINHGAALGWCAAIKVENFETKKPKRVAIGRDWMDAFLAQADRDRLPHAAAAMLFMHQSAPRIGEVVRVLPEDVDLERRVILLAHTKEEDNVERAITRELVIRIANLQPWPRPIGDTRPRTLFGYSSRFTLLQAIERICRRAGIRYLGSHQPGRHSAASRALDEGFSVADVMEGYGWKSPRVLLETYAHAEGAGSKMAARLDAVASQSVGQETAKPLRRRAKSR